MAKYLSWNLLFQKSYYATAKDELSKNQDAMKELEDIGKNGIFEVSKNKYSKCTHRNYPMIELKQYIDNIVLNSNMFFP